MTHRKTTPPPEATDARARVSVTLTDQTAYLTRYDPQGSPIATYPVAVGDVAAAFNPFGADTGLLPDCALFWQNRGGLLRIGVWLLPAVRALTIATGDKRGEETVAIPLPGFVFVGCGTAYSIYAAPARPVSLGDRLYHTPLPNVDSGGLICAGAVRFPVCSPEAIAGAARLFFESAFNFHLSAGKIAAVGRQSRRRRPGGDADVRQMVAEPGDLEEDDEFYEADEEEGDEGLIEFLHSLQGKRTFPLRRLVPLTTIQQVITND